MGKRITQANDLPIWFDTSKYDFATQLNAVGWYEQLQIRGLCHEIALTAEKDIEGLNEFYGCDSIELLSAVRANPLFSCRDNQFQQCVEEWMGVDHPLDYQSANPPGIFGITPCDIREIVWEWEPNLQKEFLDWLQVDRAPGSRATRKKPPRPRRNWIFRPVTSKYITPIQINPHFPDKVLQKSLNLFISNQRKKMGSDIPLKDKRSNTFNEWCNCGLLQYLDLSIWSLQENTSITNKAFVQGIFPKNFEKGEENIRTTTKKHAAIILNQQAEPSLSMSVLFAYARLEGFLESSEPD